MNYQEFKNAVVKYAADNKVNDYELYYNKSDETSVEIFQKEVKGFSSANNIGVCFRCIVNGQTGYASTENMTEEEAESIVLRAIETQNPWKVKLLLSSTSREIPISPMKRKK